MRIMPLSGVYAEIRADLHLDPPQEWGDRRTVRATGNGTYRWIRSKH